MIDALPGDIFHQGQVLNNTYEIEGVLGRGGIGEVYRARNQISERVVAIKALNSQFSGNDDYIELMKREEQMRDVLDDAVVRYTECSRSDKGHVFLVMDFVDGPSIADVMARRRLEPRELMIIAHRISEGLVAAHKNGIVHRDLSPDNIILRGDNPERATIIDFGIAKDTAAGARTIVGNDFAGKYEYAAPEQLEGRAEARSDLYALGALLLAGFRGQVPFAGATPGEMIRRKQAPLDVSGVPDPLKGLITWLSAPSLTERAPSAEAVVEKLNQNLKRNALRGRPGAKVIAEKPPKSPVNWGLLLVLLLGLGSAGAYVAGIFDPLFVKPLPVVSPYVLTASGTTDGQVAKLSGNAPDLAAQAAIVAAFATVSGGKADAMALSLADGMPTAHWPTDVAELLQAIAGIEDWKVNLSGTAATVSGVAADAAAHKAAEARLQGWATKGGFALSLNLATGPRLLPYGTVAGILAKATTCGPLTQSGTEGEPYPLGATIEVGGNAADDSLAPAIQAELGDKVGDRAVKMAVNVLNASICDVRQVLPDVPVLPDSTLSIWLGQGTTGEVNLSGVFHTNDIALIDVMAPADMADAHLWVVAVDISGNAYNVLPNDNFQETSLNALGDVVNGVRRIRVMHSESELWSDPRRLMFRITEDSYGKSEIIAFLSRDALFAERRKQAESIAGFVAAIAQEQKDNPGNIIGIATRILDATP